MRINELERKKQIFMQEFQDQKEEEKAEPDWWQVKQSSHLMQAWYFLMGLVMLASIFIGPVNLIFPGFHASIIDYCWLIDVLFAFDMVLNFVTIRTNIETIDPRDIVINYIFRCFWLDLAVLLPTIIVSQPR